MREDIDDGEDIDDFFIAVWCHAMRLQTGAPSRPPLLDDRYELHAVRASSERGQIFEAWDRQRGVFVALKHVRAGDLETLQARAAVDHPNLVKVVDVLPRGEERLIAMESVEGPTASIYYRRARRRRRREGLASIADALAVLHDAGLVHGDVKPSNVRMIGGRPVLVDLGVDPVPVAHKHIAPEVRLGQQPDARSDQYSFGVMMLELCGHWGDLGAERLAKRAMSSEPGDRWPDMRTLAAELRRRPWRPRIASTVVVVAILGLVISVAMIVGLRVTSSHVPKIPSLRGYHEIERLRCVGRNACD